MPLENSNEIVHYLKAISMFDPKTDFDNEESKRDLSLLFRKLIMSDDDKAREFITRFLKGVDKVIKDMNIVDSSATDGSEDEVDMSPTPPDGNEAPPVGDTPPSSTTLPPFPTEPKEQMGDSYNHLLDMANSYIYM